MLLYFILWLLGGFWQKDHKKEHAVLGEGMLAQARAFRAPCPGNSPRFTAEGALGTPKEGEAQPRLDWRLSGEASTTISSCRLKSLKVPLPQHERSSD